MFKGWAGGKTSTFYLGTTVSLSWQDVKLILLLFKMVLLMTFEMLLWTSCFGKKSALHCYASYWCIIIMPSYLMANSKIELPSSIQEWGYGLLFEWFLVVNYMEMSRIVLSLVLIFKTHSPQIPSIDKFVGVNEGCKWFF